jgi:hypothetical protein
MTIYADDLERVLRYIISKTDFSNICDKPVNYHWGNQQELNRYLIRKGENIQSENSIKEPAEEKKYKYPLIWLVLPNTGTKYEADWIIHRKTRLVISKNTKSDLLNDVRWNISFDLLTNIANTLLNKIEGVYMQIYKTTGNIPQVSITKYPNYSTNEKENKTIDIWDALVIDLDLIVKTNCITTEILNYEHTNRQNKLC